MCCWVRMKASIRVSKPPSRASEGFNLYLAPLEKGAKYELE